MSLTTAAARADLALRVAALTVYADHAYQIDPTGWLSAQLLDLRDLLDEHCDDAARHEETP